MPNEIDELLAGQQTEKPNFLESIVEDTKQSFRAAGMMLHLYEPADEEERKVLKRRFLADAALIAASSVTGGAAGAAMKGVRPIAQAILGGALSGAAGSAAFAGVEGEPVGPAALFGGALGAAGGAVAGKIGEMGANVERRAMSDKVLLARKALAAKELKEIAPKAEAAHPLYYARKAMPQIEAEIKRARMGPAAKQVQEAFDDALRISTEQLTFEGDVPVTIEMGRFPGNQAGFRITVDPKAGTKEQRAAAHEAVRNMMLGSGIKPELLFRKSTEEVRRMTEQLPNKPVLDTEAGKALQESFKNFLRERQGGGPQVQARVPRKPGRARMGARPHFDSLLDDLIGEDPAPRGIAVANEAGRRALLKVPYGERIMALFTDVASFAKRATMAAGDVVGAMGPTGAACASRMSDVVDRSARHAATHVIEIEDLLKKLPLRERVNVAHVLNGSDVAVNDATRMAAKRIGEILEEVGVSAKESGLRVYNTATGKARPFELKQHYYPLEYSEKTKARYLTPGTEEHERAIEAFIKSGQAVSRAEAQALLRRYMNPLASEFNYGHLQIARQIALPGWEEDPLKVLPQYLLRGIKRIETAKEFGPRHGLAADMVRKIGAEGGDSRLAAQVYRAFADAEPLAFRELANTTRNANILSMLSTAGLVQFSQHANTIAYTGYKNYMQGLALYLSRNPEARQLAARSGAYMQEMIQDLVPYGERGITSKFLQGIGLTPLDKANRIIASFAGMFHADDIAAKFVGAEGKRAEQLARDIVRMGLDPREIAAQAGKLTPEQRLIAGQKISHTTQFRGNVLDLPILKHTALGQFVYLFKTFAIQQTRFIGGLMSEFKKGNSAPLIRYLSTTATLTPFIGDAVQKARELIRGREPERAEGYLSLIENAAIGGAFGVASDMYTAMAEGPEFMGSFIFGPTFKQAFDLAGHDIPEAVRGRPEVLMHDTLRHIPLFGRRVADALVPLD